MSGADPLRGYPAISIGGQAIQRGRDLFDAGEPCPPNQWPYLACGGWYARKAEFEARMAATPGQTDPVEDRHIAHLRQNVPPFDLSVK